MKLFNLLILVLLFSSVTACSSWNRMNDRERGAIIGGAGGAGVGSAIGGTTGAVVGGAAGVLGGGIIGDDMDRRRGERR